MVWWLTGRKVSIYLHSKIKFMPVGLKHVNISDSFITINAFVLFTVICLLPGEHHVHKRAEPL